MSMKRLTCEQCGRSASHYTVDGAESKLVCSRFPGCRARHGCMSLIVAVAIGYALGGFGFVHADSGVIDRQLIERLVRAVEANAQATQAVARAVEHHK